ncbi:MAG: response regulator, partial [Bacteroidales bacterium]|nr:response regulator [Bacteroidales bacterium]
VNNAFKFTSSGYISIGVDPDEERKEVCIYVEDTGEGISDEHQKMIFDRFYKVDEFAQGTGLGLSICQVIVDKLKGRITLSSEKGKGSRFGIVLPLEKQTDDLPEQEELPAGHIIEESSDQDGNLPVVLIAEDSVSNYMVLNNILKKHCHIIWTINGKDALQVIKKRHVDLVLLDIKMHEMDGITALKKIRKIHKNLPVIIQTAYAFEENRKLAAQAGASGFIAKPVTPDELMILISNYIETHDKVKNTAKA